VAAGPSHAVIARDRIRDERVMRLHVVDDQPVGVAVAIERDGPIGDRRRRHGAEVVVPGVLPDLVESGEVPGVEIPIGPGVAGDHRRPAGLGAAAEGVLEPLRGGTPD